MSSSSASLARTLFKCILNEDYPAAQTLLENGANPNTILSDGATPFHISAGLNEQFTRLMLEYGGDPNVRSTDGITPLHVAASYGRCLIVDLLLEAGSDPALADDDGQLPLTYAKLNGCEYCTTKLQYHHSHINAGTCEKENASHFFPPLPELDEENETERQCKVDLHERHQRLQDKFERVRKWSLLASELSRISERTELDTCGEHTQNISEGTQVEIKFDDTSVIQSEASSGSQTDLLNVALITTGSQTDLESQSDLTQSREESSQDDWANYAYIKSVSQDSTLINSQADYPEVKCENKAKTWVNSTTRVHAGVSAGYVPPITGFAAVRTYNPAREDSITDAQKTKEDKRKSMYTSSVEETLRNVDLSTHLLDVTSPDHPVVVSREEEAPSVLNKTVVAESSDEEAQNHDSFHTCDSQNASTTAVPPNKQPHCKSDKVNMINYTLYFTEDESELDPEFVPEERYGIKQASTDRSDSGVHSINSGVAKIELGPSRPTGNHNAVFGSNPFQKETQNVHKTNNGNVQVLFGKNPFEKEPSVFPTNKHGDPGVLFNKNSTESPESNSRTGHGNPGVLFGYRPLVQSKTQVSKSPNGRTEVLFGYRPGAPTVDSVQKIHGDANVLFADVKPFSKNIQKTDRIMENISNSSSTVSNESVLSYYCDDNAKEVVHSDDSGFSVIEIHYPNDSSILSNASVLTLEDPETSVKVPAEVIALSNGELSSKLAEFGEKPGPINVATRRLYERRLVTLMLDPQLARQKDRRYLPELQQALNGVLDTSTLQDLEHEMALPFQDSQKAWREGNVKSSFNYLLLDPRKTKNLPARAKLIGDQAAFQVFIESIFYIGKGKKSRPFEHFKESIKAWNNKSDKLSAKVSQILAIWKEGLGVVTLHIFSNTIPVEAYTREGCMLEAIGMANVTNIKKGEFYGQVSSWPAKKKRLLGSRLLKTAFRIFLLEGERQIKPGDVQQIK